MAELIRTRKDKSYDDVTDTNIPTDNDVSIKNTSDVGQLDVNVSSDTSKVPIKEKVNVNTSTDNKSDVGLLETDERPSKKSKLEVEEKEEEEESYVTYTSLDLGEEYYDSSCTECKRSWKAPLKQELVMYLHALTYKVYNCVNYARVDYVNYLSVTKYVNYARDFFNYLRIVILLIL